MNDIIARWEQPEGQPFPGLWFEFRADGTFRAEFAEMGIISGGRYTTAGSQIDMDQTEHTLGMVGKFAGLYAIEGDTLKMALGGSGEPRPEDLSDARLYRRVEPGN